MFRHEFKRGDIVRFIDRASGSDRPGRLGQIVSDPTEVCVNHHKGDYETRCRVKFAGGEAELELHELELADAVDQLGRLAGSGPSPG